jgi:hypothetical protein
VGSAYAFWHLLAAVLLGVLLSALLDLGRAFARGFDLTGALLHLADLVSWAVAAGVTFYAAYILIGFTLRFYVAFGLATGGGLYLLLASPTLLPVETGLFRALYSALALPWRAVIGVARRVAAARRRSGRDGET